ncbi:protease modulator HflC [Methylocella sp.]|uniref:protease modulator HflC n=1 Tax=Methylocella sp. TaxID=1978226 RepID=UPI0037849CA9
MTMRWRLALLALAGVFVWLLSSALFTVQEGGEAIVIRFGRPVAVVTRPGLHVKAPLIDVVVVYDARLLPLEPPAEQIILGDQKRIEVDTYTRFRIADPLLFYQSLRSVDQARLQLGQLVGSSLRRELGRVPLSSLLTEERSRIVDRVEDFVRREAQPLGVDIVESHIHRADLPFETSQAIYDRMKSERVREAKELRAQGFEKAQEIKSRADRDRTVLLSEAERNSRAVRGEADAQAIELYAGAYGRDPDFYRFYRSLQSYRSALADAAPTLVLSPSAEFLKSFSAGPRSARQDAQKDAGSGAAEAVK